MILRYNAFPTSPHLAALLTTVAQFCYGDFRDIITEIWSLLIYYWV